MTLDVDDLCTKVLTKTATVDNFAIDASLSRASMPVLLCQILELSPSSPAPAQPHAQCSPHY